MQGALPGPHPCYGSAADTTDDVNDEADDVDADAADVDDDDDNGDVERQVEQSPVARDTAESFLKEVLRHYKVDASAVMAKALLTCRAKLFYRLGKLITQGWPATNHAVQTALAKVEEKYALELIACSGISAGARPGLLYKPPAMVVTKGTAASAASAKVKDPKPAEDAFEIFEEVDPAAAPATPLGAAGAVPATPLEAGGAAPATPLGAASAAPATPPQAGPASALYAYELGAAAMSRLPHPDWTPMPGLVWQALAEQGLRQMHLRHKLVAKDVEVSVLEASAPLVYQARALRDFAEGTLILIPFTTELIPFAAGERLKRPKSLHPHLPFAVSCKAGCLEIGDVSRFLLRSPLASASGLPTVAPAAFWAALATDRPEDANMKVVTYNMAVEETTFTLDGESADGPAAKRRRTKGTPKSPNVAALVPALVNKKVVKRGTVLVHNGDIDLPDMGASAEP